MELTSFAKRRIQTEMVVGVNLLSLRIEGGGTRHFAESLLLEFTSPPFNRRHLLLAFCLPELEAHVKSLFASAPNVSIVAVESIDQIQRCSDLFDIYFCPLNALYPILKDRPSVACLMDIQERFMPENFTSAELELRATLYSSLVNESTIACTISDFCKDSFIDKLGADPSAVQVVRLYPQKRLLDAGSDPLPELSGPFIVYPANWYAHKNVKNLVTGYLAARKHNGGLPRLVLVGHPLKEGNQWLSDLAEGDPSAKAILNLTEISADRLRWLYEKAEYVILPTLFEGYCMPLAEAIVLGRPVLANDLPVMREIGGEWPVYRTLETSEQICHAILEMETVDLGKSEMPLPPALEGWNWTQIAFAYETIFNQALVKHRVTKAGR